MSKVLQTKQRILEMLSRENQSLTGLSKMLNLTTATVSQHLNELKDDGAVRLVENTHFRRYKYYYAVKEYMDRPKTDMKIAKREARLWA